MGRKVFLSILGTSFYNECVYVKGNFKSAKTRFIQEATLEYLDVCNTWNLEKDKIYIFLTDKAKADNWTQDNAVRTDHKGNPCPYIRLEKVLNDKKITSPFLKGIAIPEGLNENEFWSIFEIIFNVLQREDELYLDITHGFRSIPMMLLVLCNYAKFLKHTNIKYISYGNFETRNKETNEVPIIDLLPLVTLQDWTYAAANFIENGRTEDLKMLCDERANQIFKSDNIDGKQQIPLLRRYVGWADSLCKDMQLCQGSTLLKGETIKRMNEAEISLPTALIRPFKPILGSLIQSTKVFYPQEDIHNLFAAANWCYNKKMYQQSVTLLQEGIISYCCHLKKLDVMDATKRTLISKYFASAYITLNGKGWEEKFKGGDEEKEQVKVWISEKFCMDMVNRYINLGKMRNHINHAGMHKEGFKNTSIIKTLSGYLSFFKNRIVKE